MAAMDLHEGYTMCVAECAHAGVGCQPACDDTTTYTPQYDCSWLDDWVQKIGGPSRIVGVVIPEHGSSMVSSKLPHAEHFTLPKSCFDFESGFEMIQKLENVVDRCHKYRRERCMWYGAVHALSVVAEAEFGLLPHATAVKVIKEIQSVSHMDIIHSDCLDMLNIFARIPTRGKKWIPSLFHNMSKFCVTKGGRKLLRSNLMQPPRDVHLISKRQDCLEEMIEDDQGLLGVRSALSGLSETANGADGLLKIMSKDPEKGTSSDKIAMLTSGLIDLKKFCDSLILLKDSLNSFHSDIFECVRRKLDPQVSDAVTEMLTSLFDESIIETVTRDSKKTPFITKTQQIFALKSGCQLLDAHRNRFTVATEHVHELASTLRMSYPVECGTLSIKYSWARGFFFLIQSRNSRDPSQPYSGQEEGGGEEQPAPFPQSSGLVCLSDNGKTIQATCEELNALNMRIHDSSTTCLKITEDILRERCGSVVNAHLEWIVSLQDMIGEIDMISAMAVFCSQKDGYTRPILTHHGPLIIQQGRHPLLEDNLDAFTPNDTYLADDCSIQILSGPNMAGKSTYLKQNGILVVLAQIGSFVPSSFMCLTPFKNIAMVKENSIQRQGSTFNTQMLQVTRTIRNLCSKSLVLVDELCDSSSSSDSIALSWAIIETLVCSNAKALVATHVSSLGSNLRLLYPNCSAFRINLCLSDSNETQENNRKIEPGGISDSEHYGIALAERLGFPPQVTQDARNIAEGVLANISGGLNIQSIPGLLQERAILKMCSKIDCIRELYENKAIGEDQLFETLCKIQSTTLDS